MAVNDVIIGSELNVEFDQGNIEADKISIKIDDASIVKSGTGVLSSATGSMSYDSGSATLTYNSGVVGAADVTIDLSALTSEVYVDGGSFDAASSVLTLTDNDGGTADITIDLSTLLGVSTDANNLLSNGADGKALFTKTDLDAQTTILVSRFGTQLGRVVNL